MIGMSTLALICTWFVPWELLSIILRVTTSTAQYIYLYIYIYGRLGYGTGGRDGRAILQASQRRSSHRFGERQFVAETLPALRCRKSLLCLGPGGGFQTTTSVFWYFVAVADGGGGRSRGRGGR